MKRFLLSVCAVLLFAVAPASAEEVKDLYGYSGEIIKDACTHDRDWDAQLWSQIGKQQAAYKRAREAKDWEATAILTPMTWVESWQYIRLGKDLIDTIIPKDGLSSAEKAALSEAREWYDKALTTANNAIQCRTNSLTKDEVSGQVLACLAKARSGLLYVDRCEGKKDWPSD